MPLPDRPVAGADIETAWGQDVHDRVFAPKGCHVYGGAVTAVQNVVTQLPLDTAASDPGGMLDAANDRVEVQTGGEGLYVYDATIAISGGTSSDFMRVSLRVNGSDEKEDQAAFDTGTITRISVVGIIELTAGDLFTFHALKRGSAGADPDAYVETLRLVRIGDDYGA